MPLILTHTPGEWEGTFTIAARALLTNLLPEGPLPARLTGEDGTVIEGTLTQFDWGSSTDTVFFADGRAADLDEVCRIEVP